MSSNMSNYFIKALRNKVAAHTIIINAVVSFSFFEFNHY